MTVSLRCEVRKAEQRPAGIDSVFNHLHSRRAVPGASCIGLILWLEQEEILHLIGSFALLRVSALIGLHASQQGYWLLALVKPA